MDDQSVTNDISIYNLLMPN